MGNGKRNRHFCVCLTLICDPNNFDHELSRVSFDFVDEWCRSAMVMSGDDSVHRWC